MALAKPVAARWLWYAIRTPHCVPLDAEAYPSVANYHGDLIPWPDWACKGPEGGVHLNASVGRIDIQVANAPRGRQELQWSCNFAVFLIADSWLSEIADLVESDGVSLGQLSVAGEALQGWSTIHEVRPPPLLATEGRAHACPFCGYSYTVLHGREYFSDPAIEGRSLVVNSNGIFVREDLAIERNIRIPAGAFKPSAVKLEVS